MTLIERVVARATTASQFGLPAATELFHSRLLPGADGQPLQLEGRFVNPACAPDYLDIDFQVEIPHQYLMRTAPLQRTEHAIEAGAADKRLARVLEVEPGAALLTLSRRTWSRGHVASHVRLTHPAGKYRFSLHDLKRKGGTDTPGNRAEKQDALGVSEAMMNVYDKSVPRVKPSAQLRSELRRLLCTFCKYLFLFVRIGGS